MSTKQHRRCRSSYIVIPSVDPIYYYDVLYSTDYIRTNATGRCGFCIFQRIIIIIIITQHRHTRTV